MLRGNDARSNLPSTLDETTSRQRFFGGKHRVVTSLLGPGREDLRQSFVRRRYA